MEDRQTDRPTDLGIEAPSWSLKIGAHLLSYDLWLRRYLQNGTDIKKLKTRLGLQCQTPALSKVYFTWVGAIILGLKNFG